MYFIKLYCLIYYVYSTYILSVENSRLYLRCDSKQGRTNVNRINHRMHLVHLIVGVHEEHRVAARAGRRVCGRARRCSALESGTRLREDLDEHLILAHKLSTSNLRSITSHSLSSSSPSTTSRYQLASALRRISAAASASPPSASAMH